MTRVLAEVGRSTKTVTVKIFDFIVTYSATVFASLRDERIVTEEMSRAVFLNFAPQFLRRFASKKMSR